MALTPAPTTGSPGIDQLSPAQVLRTARLFGSDPALPSLVGPDEKESLWVELDSSPTLIAGEGPGLPAEPPSPWAPALSGDRAMSIVADLKDVVEPFLGHAIRGDATSAVRLTLDLVDQGASVESVIVELLAAAQYECGERWQRNDWGVADEHLVSGVTQRCLGAIANTVAPATPAGSVVVAYAEGDWHSLPAQMFAEVLRLRGFAVAFLGASTPSDHVARLLARDRPDALIITCNLAPFFAGVSSVADAAHRTGTPVIAGGRALDLGPSVHCDWARTRGHRMYPQPSPRWVRGPVTARARHRIPPLSMVSQ